MASGEHSSPPAPTAEEGCSFILGRYPHGALMQSREEATDDCVSSVIGPRWPPCHHPGLLSILRLRPGSGGASGGLTCRLILYLHLTIGPPGCRELVIRAAEAAS